MTQRGLSATAIQTGPFASLSTPFVLEIFELFHFHTGRPILITPEGQLWKDVNLTTLKMDETEGIEWLGAWYIHTVSFVAQCRPHL